MKLAIFKDGFWLFLLASVGAHASFLVITPNPLKQAETPTEMEVVGTVPVVTLPKKKNSASSPSPQPNLSQIPKKDIPTDESPKPTVVDIPKKIEPEKTVKEPVKTEPKPAQKSEPKIDKNVEKNEQKSDQKNDRLDPHTESSTENSTKESDSKETQDPNTKKPDVAKSDLEADRATSAATLSPDQFRREFGKTYAEYAIKYGKENVVQRIIPSPQETTVSQVSQTIEPGIEWIPPLEQPKANDIKGKNTKVIVTFIVDPKGKVVKKSMFSSRNSNIDEIVKKTVAGYESKFMPLEGKIRIVTINYNFPG